jgi:hypothetical protein
VFSMGFLLSEIKVEEPSYHEDRAMGEHAY